LGDRRHWYYVYNIIYTFQNYDMANKPSFVNHKSEVVTNITELNSRPRDSK